MPPWAAGGLSSSPGSPGAAPLWEPVLLAGAGLGLSAMAIGPAARMAWCQDITGDGGVGGRGGSNGGPAGARGMESRASHLR